MGIERMKADFKRFPEQYKTNFNYLKSLNDNALSGISFLEKDNIL
jgi:hypothetical protein